MAYNLGFLLVSVREIASQQLENKWKREPNKKQITSTSPFRRVAVTTEVLTSERKE